MSCSSATFNPAAVHPASLSSDSEQIESTAPPKYLFCAREILFKTRQETYALAESTFSGDVISLTFQIQTRPFEEMISFLSENRPPLSAPSGEPSWAQQWVQQFQPHNRTWTVIRKIENSENVKRMLINAHCPKSQALGSILLAIGECRKWFPNVNLSESAYNVQHGFASGHAEDIFVSDNPTSINIRWK